MLAQISGKEFPRLLHRYCKLTDGQLDQIETIADTYLSGTVKSSALPLIGGVGIGLYIGAVSLQIVGAIAGSSLIYGAISSAIQKGRNAECIKDSGLLAPFLKERDLIAYADVVGVAAIVAEIEQAYQEGQKVSSAARRFMRQMGQPLQRRTIARYVESLQTEPSIQPELVRSGTCNPTQTKAETTIQKATATRSPQLQNIQLLNIAEALAYNIKPTIISARPRVGKGIIISHTIGYAKQMHGVTAWVLQPKPYPDELGYWKQCDRFLGLNLEDYPKDDPQIAAQMTEFFLAWRSQAYRPTLLVIDELVKIQAMQPKWYKDFLIPQCIVEGSSGETDKRYLYLVTQSPLVGDLGMSGGNRSTFDFMAIEKASTSEHLESVRKSVASLRSTPSVADYQRSPVGCLAFHSGAGCWFAVPEYGVPRIAPGDELCAELSALVRPGVESGVLPQEWEAIGRAVVAMNSTGVVTQKGDAIEGAILEFLKSRSDGVTAGRMRADKKALKSVALEEIEIYLSVLVEEGKVVQDGNLYFCVDP